MQTASLGPLLTPRDVLDESSDRRCVYDRHSLAVLTEASRYISEFLTRPHPALGRPGAVCPFAAGGVQRNSIMLAASLMHEPDRAALIDALIEVRSMFELDEAAADSPDEIYRAIVIVFPHLPSGRAAELVDSVQKELKADFVARGLMIGEFYPGCPAPGLHNIDFRPLDTTFSSMAISRMTVSDLPFMMDEDRFISSYLQNFELKGFKRLSNLLDQQNCTPDQRDMIRRLLGPNAPPAQAHGSTSAHAHDRTWLDGARPLH